MTTEEMIDELTGLKNRWLKLKKEKDDLFKKEKESDKKEKESLEIAKMYFGDFN